MTGVQLPLVHVVKRCWYNTTDFEPLAAAHAEPCDQATNPELELTIRKNCIPNFWGAQGEKQFDYTHTTTMANQQRLTHMPLRGSHAAEYTSAKNTLICDHQFAVLRYVSMCTPLSVGNVHCQALSSAECRCTLCTICHQTFTFEMCVHFIWRFFNCRLQHNVWLIFWRWDWNTERNCSKKYWHPNEWNLLEDPETIVMVDRPWKKEAGRLLQFLPTCVCHDEIVAPKGWL